MRQSFVILLCLGMIITGCINSIATKYQDKQCVRNCLTDSPELLQQPVLQTVQMFLGEASALFAFYLLGARPSTSVTKFLLQNKNTVLLSIPAVCDICGTTMMHLALTLVPVSIYQMVRGSLVIVVATFSVVFLNKKLTRGEWLSLYTVMFGIGIVGLTGFDDWNSDKPAANTLLGITLILVAQLFMAAQYVIEEHLISRYPFDSLEVVGFEGLFGGAITLFFLLLGTFTIAWKDPSSPLNLFQGLKDVSYSGNLMVSSFTIMISIAFYNFFGIAITNHMNATSRSTIDTSRTLLVWLVSLILGWERFSFLQLIGFALSVVGTLIFNGAISFANYQVPQRQHDYYGYEELPNDRS
ncbi:Sly41p Ecym_5262 [Eremothecium cymbalariae DBVPG|uniref:Sugar phosphate transporter domain-containing protein n=1 Tax=Eremothecium cymbalariae (strain CBS 270.75 / DBVPG 7215 / KCTC 17166 / NRRL Y-17582) TaxID=931890 RepID=I6ND85_ERECY|nr:hypothetical protein Ecym_5262 [Eremothecium cymbalariae DBVPG\